MSQSSISRITHGEWKKKQRFAAYKVRESKRKGYINSAAEHICVDCGRPAQVYDHRDYDKPLDIIPVCITCNKSRGPALPEHEPRTDYVYKIYNMWPAS